MHFAPASINAPLPMNFFCYHRKKLLQRKLQPQIQNLILMVKKCTFLNGK